MLQQAKQRIEQADFIVIGAGAGFSAAAGLTYSGERFTQRFQPFIQRYGMQDMYSAGFYPFETEEEKWAYWAEHIWANRFEPSALPLYQQLFALMKDKNYFVITTNVDSQFAKAGFDPDKLFEVQGNYGELQCAKPCHSQVYDNETLVQKWRSQQKNCQIPTALVPKCPVCGGKMAMHLRIDHRFVETEQWHIAQQRYATFAEQAMQGNTVYLELGIGFNTPSIIRYPFEQMTYRNPQATLIRLNRDHPEGFAETAKQTIALTQDPNAILSHWLQE